MTTQFNLVCDNASTVKNLSSVGFFGFMCCQVYAGFLGDLFGRKPMMLVGLALMSGTGYILSYFNEYSVIVYAVGQFVMCFTNFHYAPMRLENVRCIGNYKS